MTLNKLLVILGPTATGKTDLALSLAKKFNGELVGCDSRQVYIGLDIGTGKMPNSKLQITKGNDFWEIGGVKIWMYDVLSPKKQYTVADYVKDANKVIDDIRERDRLPIIVGGTGLYLKALLDGLPNLEIPIDPALRKKLDKLSREELQKKLQEISPRRWNSLNKSDRENPRRLIRAIELTAQNQSRLPRHFVPRNDVLKIGLTAPRDILYKCVDERVISRINQGMVEEGKNLHKAGLSYRRMRQLGLEYGVLADYLEGNIRDIQGNQGLKSVSSQASLIKVMQNKIHGFVRRQLTRFKKEKKISWFDITEKDYIKKVEKLISSWYDQSQKEYATKNRYFT